MESRSDQFDSRRARASEGFSIRDHLEVLKVDEFSARNVACLIQSANERDVGGLRDGIAKYYSVFKSTNIDQSLRPKLDRLIEERVGPEGVLAMCIQISEMPSQELAELSWCGIETYHYFIDSAKRAEALGEQTTAGAINKSLMTNLPRVAREQSWGVEEEAMQRRMIENLYGYGIVDLAGNNSENEPAQEIDSPESIPKKPRLWDKLRGRLNKVKTAIYNPWDLDNWKDALGDKEGKNSKRNVIIGASVGVATVAAAFWLSNKGVAVDTSSVDIAGDIPVPSGSSTTIATEVPSTSIFDVPPVADVPVPTPEPSIPEAAPVIPVDAGLSIESDMPWTIASELNSGSELSAMESAMAEYSSVIGADVAFVGEGGNTMIQVGDRIASPGDVKAINEILFNQSV